MPFGFFDPTFILLIPAILLGLYARWRVKAAYNKYAQVRTRSGLTGAEVAAHIMQGQGTAAGVEPGKEPLVRGGIPGIRIEAIGGMLSDHYDPSAHVLRLSQEVYAGDSIAAVSVAAHETGHALQHSVGYPFLGLRTLAVPVANIGSALTFPIIFIGMFAGFFYQALNIAILLYLGVVAFTLLTLPVEINASRRALRVLEQGGYLAADEMPGARAVLNAAALTYVAATFSALLMLLRLIILRNMSRR